MIDPDEIIGVRSGLICQNRFCLQDCMSEDPGERNNVQVWEAKAN